MQISTTPSTSPVEDARLAEILANPGFGTHFTDHMFAVEWTPDSGWHDARITPYGPLTLDPATAVLHYAQETFEGMKAYRHGDGSVWTFRPEENAARMVRLALWNRESPDDPLASLRQFSDVAFAQAEYYYDGEDARDAWMWNMNWRARIVRVRLPSDVQDNAVLAGLCASSGAGCVELLPRLHLLERVAAH